MKHDIRINVHKLAREGLTNREISERLSITIDSVKYYKRGGLRKSPNQIMYDLLKEFLYEHGKPITWPKLHEQFKSKAEELKLKFTYRFIRQFLTMNDDFKRQIVR